MSSDPETTKIQADPVPDKEGLVASVRLNAEDEKDIRRAAVELNQSRSEFMAEAAIRRAREVLDRLPATRSA